MTIKISQMLDSDATPDESLSLWIATGIVRVAQNMSYIWEPGESRVVMINCPDYVAPRLCSMLNNYGFEPRFGARNPQTDQIQTTINWC